MERATPVERKDIRQINVQKRNKMEMEVVIKMAEDVSLAESAITVVQWFTRPRTIKRQEKYPYASK